jgi:hypothetical protein
MTLLTWDNAGERLYETGVDRGVLFVSDGAGGYNGGVPWNGLTTVTESPSGAEASPQYADNIKYLNLISAEEFAATLEAFTYPDEFAACDGSVHPSAGITIGQQPRKTFCLCYRTRLGNDVLGSEFGYKIHLVYGATAAPSEKAYATINDSPEAIAFSWEISTNPVLAAGYQPVALLTVDSTKVSGANLTSFQDIVWGSAGGNSRLPLPDEVIGIFGASTKVDLGTAANQPTYVSGTHIITLPTVTGVVWKINGVTKAAGAQPALTTGQTANVKATPATGYYLEGDVDWVFDF